MHRSFYKLLGVPSNIKSGTLRPAFALAIPFSRSEEDDTFNKGLLGAITKARSRRVLIFWD